MLQRAVSCGPQFLLFQLLLVSVTSTSDSIVGHNSNSQAENELKSKRAGGEEIESWEETELLQMSSKFLPRRHIRRVKRDDGYGHDPGHCGTFVIFPFFGFLISATFFSVSVINTVNNENNNNNENMNMNENVNSKRKRSIATSSHQRNKIKTDLCPDKTRNQCFLTSEMLSFIDNMSNKNG